MVGQILKYVATYCLGFCSGVIYTSNKYGQNPNDIFNGWKDTAQNTVVGAKDKCVEGIKSIKERKNAEKVEEPATDGGEQVC